MKKIIVILLSLFVLGLIIFFFVPAFQGKFTVSPIFDLGSFTLRWYGLIMAASVLVGFFVARKFAGRFGINPKQIPDFIFWLVIVSGVGARLFFVILEYNYFLANPIEIFKIWNGGISIYGAIITAFLFTYFYAKGKAYSYWRLLDLTALSFPLAQALGRLGNFFNTEAFGTPTNLPWKMFVSEGSRPQEFLEVSFFHPTFLYESIWNVLVFVILYKLLGRAKPGVVLFTFLSLYSVGRFFIEGIRLDSVFWGGLRVNQVVAFVIFIIAAFAIYRLQRSSQFEA